MFTIRIGSNDPEDFRRIIICIALLFVQVWGEWAPIFVPQTPGNERRGVMQDSFSLKLLVQLGLENDARVESWTVSIPYTDTITVFAISTSTRDT